MVRAAIRMESWKGTGGVATGTSRFHGRGVYFSQIEPSPASEATKGYLEKTYGGCRQPADGRQPGFAGPFKPADRLHGAPKKTALIANREVERLG